jgi:type I restriction enzyme S subunit
VSSRQTSLKRIARLVAGGTPSVDEPRFWSEDSGTPWVTIGDMTGQPAVRQTERRLTEEGIASKRLPVGRRGTVLFAMYASVGTVSILDTDASWNQAILGIEPVASLAERRFLMYWLLSLRPQLERYFRSNTQDNLNAEQVGNLPYPVLSVEQQRAIADFLDAETARIDALIAKKRQLAHLLGARYKEERRMRMLRGLNPITGSGLDVADWRTAQLGVLIGLQRGHDLPIDRRNNGTVPVISSGGAIRMA